MTTVYISPKGKAFLKKKYSGKVVEQLVNNGPLLRKNGALKMKIDGKDFTVTSAESTPAKV